MDVANARSRARAARRRERGTNRRAVRRSARAEPSPREVRGQARRRYAARPLRGRNEPRHRRGGGGAEDVKVVFAATSRFVTIELEQFDGVNPERLDEAGIENEPDSLVR